jgi:acetyl-CoA carboxylase biotin carboxyl carrier protein
MKGKDVAGLDELIRAVTRADLTEALIRVGDKAIRVRRRRGGLPTGTPGTEIPTEWQETETPTIRAHMVGYFRHIEPPLQVGDRVAEGVIVGSINSLGLENEVSSKVSGVVKEVLAEEGMPVEYGQPLFRVEPEEVS